MYDLKKKTSPFIPIYLSLHFWFYSIGQLIFQHGNLRFAV